MLSSLVLSLVMSTTPVAIETSKIKIEKEKANPIALRPRGARIALRPRGARIGSTTEQVSL